jgi:CRISPR-associated endoribonuclease Cas6
MRLILTLKPLTPKPKLMWNYHYPLASWLYGIITKADNSYARFLHEEGFHVKEKKTFKHFTFSDLQAKITYQKGDSGFRIVSPNVQWTVSFYIDKVAEKFISGLFNEKVVEVFNREYKVVFTIEKLDILPAFSHNHTTTFKATSLMVVAEKKDGNDQYLAPTDPRFGQYLIAGLIDKYLSVVKEKNEMIDASLIEQEINFQLLDTSRMKSRKITIKEHKESATEIKGYRDFIFALTGPKDVIEVGFLGGFGRYCAEGCGFCEVVTQSL